MNPAVSVIVPVYNIEKYLVECLDSLANQSLNNIQVILVDDGSTDNSGEICKEYVETHEGFEYYYKENGGTASARNVGLEHATGEFIGFVDSDDWIEPDMFETMYLKAKEDNADILYCVMQGLGDYEQIKSGTYDAEDIYREIYPRLLPYISTTGTFRTLDWGNCSRLYRNKIIQDNEIRFFSKSRRCEDFAFTVECTLHSKTYSIINKGELYHYRPNEKSKTRSYSKNMWQSIRALMMYVRQITSGFNTYDFADAVDYCIFYFSAGVIRNEMRLKNKKDRVMQIKEVIEDSFIQDAVSRISDERMNKKYSKILKYIKDRDAQRIENYLWKLEAKKKYVYPISNMLLSNKLIKKLYLLLRKK